MNSKKQSFWERVLDYPFSVIERIENSSTPFYNFIIMLFSYVMIRNLVENFWTATEIIFSYHVHFILFWIFTTLLFLFIIRIFSKIDVLNCFKVFSTFLFLILIGSVVDLISSGGKPVTMSYIFADNLREAVIRFLSFSGGYEKQFVTFGQKVHIVLILAALYLYVFIKTGKTLKSLLTVIVIYSGLYIIGILPYIFGLFGLSFDHLLYILFYFTGSVLLLCTLFYLSNRKLFMNIFKAISSLMTVHYLLMPFLGAVLAYKKYTLAPEYTPGILVVLSISVVSAFLFSVITKSFADVAAGGISNTEGSPFNRDISMESLKTLSFVALITALAGSLVAGYPVFLLLSAFIALYYLYYMPPVRLKRFPVISKLAISVNSLFLALCGYAVVAPDTNYLLRIFPISFTLFFIIPFTLSANFIDIKNYERDRQCGIRTLPVVMGLKKAKILTGIFFVIAYLFIGLIFPAVMKYCIGLGLLQFFLINRKRYSEEPVFIIYLLSVASFIYLLYSGYLVIL